LPSQQQKDQNHFTLLHNELAKHSKTKCTVLIQVLCGNGRDSFIKTKAAKEKSLTAF
jgi:hypothetical protein